MTLGDFKTIRHFTADEFEHVGGYEHVDEAVVRLADRIRHAYGRPLILKSAYRAPASNTDTGGAYKSQHLVGKALDLSPTHPDRAHYGALVMAALKHWCGGFGAYDDGHIHIDVRDTVVGARWIGLEGVSYGWTWDNLEQVIGRASGSQRSPGDGRAP
tara:strand:+ start:2038 stop:2511 length:474 start_codon:yes stop_codon:yes gene_type:complete